MRKLVLGALLRNGPGRQIRAEFRPAHSADFFAALPGQQKSLDDLAERVAFRFGALPDGLDLVVGQHAVAGLFNPGGRDGGGGGGGEDQFGNRPVEELRSEEHTSELQSLMRISYAV